MVLPGMSDGRAFTSYVSNCTVEKDISDTRGLSSSEYRRFLQDNAVQLIENSTLDMNYLSTPSLLYYDKQFYETDVVKV